MKAALALAGITLQQWTQEQGVTPSHLHQVIGGKRESAKLLAAIDEFIERHTPQAA